MTPGLPYASAEYTRRAPLSTQGLTSLRFRPTPMRCLPAAAKMPDAFKDTYKRICTEFFPQSNYGHGQGVELEVYPSADTQNPDYTCEIWIAVKEKVRRQIRFRLLSPQDESPEWSCCSISGLFSYMP